MAGGEGSRLRPLTCGLPKPMMPVANRPMMEHILELLKKHGVQEIGVTLQYLPEAIQGYFGNGSDFGVHMRYYVEEVPLGTAGSVKNAQNFLDETFVVISGDALTDLDLSQAMEFHRQKGALATLVLTPVDIPLEYGVVITDKEGRIAQFLEKPGWGEVFSDTVNTGIYILEPEVLNYFAPGQKFDFSKNLFPLLLKEKQPLFGVALSGYWCDIGNLQQYVQAHQDCLTGKVAVTIPGTEVVPGIWVGDNSVIHPDASMKGPALIGDNCRVGSGALIDAYSVIGNGCLIQEHASIKRSVLWDNVFLGGRAAIRGTVLGSQVKVKANAAIYEGSVVGSDSIIKERAILKPDVKLWPGKVVELGALVESSLVWGTNKAKNLFGIEGISGLTNIEITPEFASRVGSAYGTNLAIGTKIGLSSDRFPASRMIKEALACGLQSAGIEVVDFGAAFTPMHRFAVRASHCQGGIHIRISSQRADKINLVFTNEKGGNISRSQERKIENTMAREDVRRLESPDILPVRRVTDTPEQYLTHLCQGINSKLLREAGHRLALVYDRQNLDPFMTTALDSLGIAAEHLEAGQSTTEPKDWQWYKQIINKLSANVQQSGKAAGAIIDPNGDRLILVDSQGNEVSEEILTALISLIILKEQAGPVIVPVTAPRAIDELADKYRGMVIRTKTSQQDFIDKIMNHQLQNNQEVSHHFMNFDALLTLFKVLEFCTREGISLEQLVAEIPSFYLQQKEVAVPWEAKGRVIRRLIEEPSGELELLDGVKVFHPEGWALVLPDPEEPVCRIFTEGISMEAAEELTNFYSDKIRKISEM
ncbi:mannose-1-phosphate guanyltransferase [Desulforamulus aeronauticus]|uniref:Nucleotidyltransferase n=1 Tax=Desulforamulus aeronauticus DSM 10349 TaxID=1121421 RepID=A0A1M6R7P8_9FIRM|nr:mannose-1-phosphate guanyltransferase [Desulforamulus aeronauticus]SHK28472.1 nucleotidyltransferase [Desulforamulus aeronauticus DSM 10349]